MKIDINKIAVYNLPLFKNFHCYKKLSLTAAQKNKVFSNWGLNWWDLATNGTFEKVLPYAEYKIINGLLEDRDYASIIIVNMSHNRLEINSDNNDTYIIEPYRFVHFNPTAKNIIRPNKKLLINQILIGYSCFILLGIEDILNGKSNIMKSPIYNDLLIASGIPNKEIYYNTIGLNANLDKIIIEDDDESSVNINTGTVMLEYITMLEDHWTETVRKLQFVPKKNKIPFKYIRKSNRKLKNLFSKTIKTSTMSSSRSSRSSIPYKLHWIWLYNKPGIYGPEVSLDRYKHFMQTWAFRNPKVSLNLWTNCQINGASLPKDIIIRSVNDINSLLKKCTTHDTDVLRDIIFNHPNVGIRADTLRQLILFIEGGLYVDINDMECLMSIEPLLDNYNFICGLEPMMYINNAFIGSKPGHVIPKNFLYFIESIADRIFEEYSQIESKDQLDNWVVTQTGPIAFSSIIYGALDEYYNNGRYKELKNSVFFPSKFIYSNYEIKQSPIYWLSPVSYCAHFDERSFL